MQFKTYDILSSLIPGILVIVVIVPTYILLSNNLIVFESKLVTYKDLSSILTFAFLVISYITGYLISALGSWFEPFLFFLWRGRPSKILLTNSSKRIFLLDASKIFDFLKTESNLKIIKKGDWKLLFQSAKNISYNQSNNNIQKRIDNFNDNYIFSRNILISYIIIILALLALFFNNFISNSLIIFFIFIGVMLFIRCRDRALYYSREILLNSYPKIKILN